MRGTSSGLPRVVRAIFPGDRLRSDGADRRRLNSKNPPTVHEHPPPENEDTTDHTGSRLPGGRVGQHPERASGLRRRLDLTHHCQWRVTIVRIVTGVRCLVTARKAEIWVKVRVHGVFRTSKRALTARTRVIS